jgi:hypothetical protein
MLAEPDRRERYRRLRPRLRPGLIGRSFRRCACGNASGSGSRVHEEPLRESGWTASSNATYGEDVSQNAVTNVPDGASGLQAASPAGKDNTGPVEARPPGPTAGQPGTTRPEITHQPTPQTSKSAARGSRLKRAVKERVMSRGTP